MSAAVNRCDEEVADGPFLHVEQRFGLRLLHVADAGDPRAVAEHPAAQARLELGLRPLGAVSAFAHDHRCFGWQ